MAWSASELVLVRFKRGGLKAPLFALFDLSIFSLKLLILILGKQFKAN